MQNTMVVSILARDQRWALSRLERLLDRRCALDGDTQAADEPCEDWLVRALDHAILSYYQLARELEVGQDADKLLRHYRQASLPGCPSQGPVLAA